MLSLRCWLICATAASIVVCAGCTRWLDTKTGNSPLAPLVSAPDSVHLEIVFVRYLAGDATLDTDLWARVDEQQLPYETRLRLNENGFRVGVIDSQLPPEVEKRLRLTDRPQETETRLKADDLENESPVKQRSLQVRAGRPTKIICTGEQQKHAEMSVLIRGANNEVTGKTYRKAAGLFAARAWPEGDGRVRLELVPELEHGEPQRRYDPSDGMLRVDFGPPKEKYELLTIDAKLAPGQMILVAAIPGKVGSLGYQYFTEPDNDRKQQKLLLVRVAGTSHDDSFTSETIAKASD